MDPDVTQPIAEARTVVYRCPCGNQLTLLADEGGQCDQCRRTVSAKSLSVDMANTVVWDDQVHKLGHTTDGLSLGNPGAPAVILEDDVENDADLLIGKRFGHFEIIAPLGRGGMGQVYRALDTSLQRYVAVKVLRSGINQSDASSNAEIDKLLQEAVSQARVPHNNVVTIYYVGKEAGNPFLAMELVTGPTLNDRIAKGDLTYAETANIGLQLAGALRSSFDLDIIHGDIKPSNVLIARDGTAKLSDFGMARSVTDKQTVAAGGTPNYLAPELLRGVTTSAQSDMYALGVTLYEMTFGELPLKLYGTSVKKWIKTHDENQLEFPTPWPQDVPEAWRRVLEKLLAKNPADRYSTYDLLIKDMRRLQSQANVPARFFPRLIAAGVDWATVLLVTIGLESVPVLINNNLDLPASSRPWLALSVGLLTFVPIIVYTWGVYHWRQTVGRSLMHIKVVNQYGLPPLGSKMAIRSLLRMQFPWIVIFLSLIWNTQFAILGIIGFIGAVIFLLPDLIYMLLFNGRSLHDLVARTHVVLDTHE